MIVYASIAEDSTGALFMGGVIPGIVTAIIFIIYIMVYSYINPDKGPSISKDERFTRKEKMESLKSVFILALVIITVLGSIYSRMVTPTEAGVVGAVGSFLAAAIRKKLSYTNLKLIFIMTADLLGMNFCILIGAVPYARIVTITGIESQFATFITTLDVNDWIILLIMIEFCLSAGMLIDTVAVLLITAPFFIPALTVMELRIK